MKPVSLLKSGLWITYATFITRIFAFLSSLVLARLLQPADFGVIGIAYVFWSFFTLFIQDTAGNFIIYKGTDNPKYIDTSYTISLSIGLLLGLGMAATAPAVAMFFNEPALSSILVAFAFNLLLSSASSAHSGVMTRQMQYQALANISLVSSMTRLLCTAGAAMLGLSYWSFVVGDTASWVVSCILTRHYSGHRFRLQIDPEIRSEVLSFCLGSTFSSFGLYVNFNTDNFTVGKLLGSASLGYYNLAYQLTMAASSIFSSVISQLGMPVFAQLPTDEQQKNTLSQVVEQTAFFIAPLYALMFLIFDPQVVTFVFGSKWIPICTVIPGLLFFAYFRVINSLLFSMLVAKGRPDINARVNLQIAPIAVLSFVVGARQGGIVGVSLAAALILGIFWTIYWWLTGCRILGWPLKKFLLPCFIPILLSVPGVASSFALPLLLRPFVFLLIYLVCIRILMPKHFFLYQSVLDQLVNRLAKLRFSR
ncbi:MAG: oligosaccharide flippase family protein [Myxacorys californica WJT36-NPBG1]|jgi:O-antigen/teichoic acid export membrane protein|nr:oligosaccharide flippase family protein [Myxacorys californica WJT36-NPBG1]